MKNSINILEIACFNLNDAELALKAGADRIEFCRSYLDGGLTPDYNEVEELKKKYPAPVFVMIRPRAGDFNYSDSEFEEMKTAIRVCKEKNADGVVFGILDANQCVDEARNKALVSLASPMMATFHRAFDRIQLQHQAIEQIIRCGFTRILTSGKSSRASENSNYLAELIMQFKSRIIIIPGGGIRSSNLKTLIDSCRAREYHSAALGNNNCLDENEIKVMKSILRQ